MGIRGASRSITPPRTKPAARITTAVEGVTGVKEEFVVSGNESSETVQFSDGTNSGSVSYTAGVTSGASPPSGYDQIDTTGSPSMLFRAQAEGPKPDMALTNGFGSVDVTQQGAGTAAQFHISFGGAGGGTVEISGSSPIPFDVDAATLESTLEAALGEGVSVGGSAGEFDLAFDAMGPKSLAITANNLTF